MLDRIGGNLVVEQTPAFGYSKAEVVGRPIELLYADSSKSSQVDTLMRGRGRFSGEIRSKRKGGEVFFAHLSASVIRDAQGKAIGGHHRAQAVRAGDVRAWHA